MKALLAVLLLAGLAGSAQAAGYSTIGKGTGSCQEWTSVRNAPRGEETSGNEQWVVGFLSGIGFMMLGELDPLRGLDANTVYGWMDKYCRDHPPEKIEAAMRVFIQEHPR